MKGRRRARVKGCEEFSKFAFHRNFSGPAIVYAKRCKCKLHSKLYRCNLLKKVKPHVHGVEGFISYMLSWRDSCMVDSWASDQVSRKHESIDSTVTVIALERDLGDA